MSDSLKNRLKKCGRSYNSPVIGRPKVATATSCTQKHDVISTTPEADRKTNSISQAHLAFKSPVGSCLTPTIAYKKSYAHWTSDDTPRRSLSTDFEVASRETVDKSGIDSDVRGAATTNKRKREEYRGDVIKTESVQENVNSEDIDAMKHLRKTVANKEEMLRKLKMVKLYRSKNNLDKLERLISKWRAVSQEALVRLLSLAQEPQPTLTQLVDHLQLNHCMIGFSPEEESFSQ